MRRGRRAARIMTQHRARMHLDPKVLVRMEMVEGRRKQGTITDTGHGSPQL